MTPQERACAEARAAATSEPSNAASGTRVIMPTLGGTKPVMMPRVEVSELFDALTDCGLEARRARQSSFESEDLPRGRAGVVEHQQTLTQTI